MDRTIIAPMEQMRDFDFVSFEKDALKGLGALAQDVLSQLSSTIVAGLVATATSPASLSVAIGPGRIYFQAPSDAVSAGSIPQDLTTVVQQGINLGQTLTLTAPAAGQSQWNLIQCQFSQVDAIRSGDPNNGLVPFYNSSNPTVPNPTSLNTVRQGRLILQVISGAAATTGSQVPPTPSTNWTPLYLVSLVGGQTQITTPQVIKAGPSVGTGVPANYPTAPFLAGLLASHHSGALGQAPKINLALEVSGVLPYANMSPVRTLLGSALTLYVNVATGSDSNNGLGPTAAFATVQAAANAAYRNYDFNGNQLTINIANGTYTAVGVPVLNLVGLPLGCPSMTVTGNIGSPGSVLLSSTMPAGGTVQAVFGAIVIVQGVTIVNTGTSGGGRDGIVAINSQLTLANIVMGSCPNYQIIQSFGGLIVFNGPVTFTGNCTYSVASASGGALSADNQSVTFSVLNCSGGWALSNACGLISLASVTFVGTFTGQRFLAEANGVIGTNGQGVNYIPGSVAGVISSGGQYI